MSAARHRFVHKPFCRNVHAEVGHFDHLRLQTADDNAFTQCVQIASRRADNHFTDDFGRCFKIGKHFFSYIGRDLRSHEVLREIGVEAFAQSLDHHIHAGNDHFENDILRTHPLPDRFCNNLQRPRPIRIQHGSVVVPDDIFNHRLAPLFLSVGR